ncbi:unnamed protein product, partial [Closterium sp. NIES-53]
MVPCSSCAPRRTVGPFLFFYPSCAPWHWHATGLSAPVLPEAAPDPSAPTPFRRSAAFFLPTPLSSFVSLQPWGGGYGGGGCWSVGSPLSLPLLLLSVPPLQLPLGGEGVRMWGSRGSGTGVAGARQHAAVPPPLLTSPPSLLLCSSVGEGKEEGEEMEGVPA